MKDILTRTSLYALPLLALIGCGPVDLTVGDKNPTMGKAGTGGSDAGGSDSSPVDMKSGGTASVDPKAGGGSVTNEMGGSATAGAPDKGTVLDFHCTDMQKTVISTKQVCDGIKDCADGSDEIMCPAPPFLCKDGTKIDPDLVCNGSKECMDGSDEADCPAKPLLCADGEKIAPELVCNGKPDCMDKSDELDCPIAPFICKNGSKLDPSLVCDGKDECGDGSDELSCGDTCATGFDKAQRFDDVMMCLVSEPLGCAMAIDPALAVPKKWPEVTCLQRKKDAALFLVPAPQLASDWDECTPEQQMLLSIVKPCP